MFQREQLVALLGAEVLRIHLLGTWVKKGEKKGRGC